jgi:hypothetical protein
MDVMFYLPPTSHEMSQKKETRTDIIMPNHESYGVYVMDYIGECSMLSAIHHY